MGAKVGRSYICGFPGSQREFEAYLNNLLRPYSKIKRCAARWQILVGNAQGPGSVLSSAGGKDTRNALEAKVSHDLFACNSDVSKWKGHVQCPPFSVPSSSRSCSSVKKKNRNEVSVN